MPKEITPLSAVLATFEAANSYSAFKHPPRCSAIGLPLVPIRRWRDGTDILLAARSTPLQQGFQRPGQLTFSHCSALCEWI